MLLTRTTSRLRLAAAILCVLFSVNPANSQAPGDGDDACTEKLDGSLPMHVHPLMDSRDYERLISTDGIDSVWQTLDKDENNEMGTQTQVQCIYKHIIIY